MIFEPDLNMFVAIQIFIVALKKSQGVQVTSYSEHNSDIILPIHMLNAE